MPELPEVETYRRYFQRYAVGKTIRAFSSNDPKNFPGMKERMLRKLVVGGSFTETMRKGKYLIAVLEGGDKSGYLVIHFGMTGTLYFCRAALRTPAYSRAVFLFDDGALHYINMRRFGGVWWVSDLRNFDRLARLGAEPLSEIPSAEALKQILRRSSQPIKQVLMNQKLVAGIGNLYADEILFQSRIDPRRHAASLKFGDWEKLFFNMKHVLREAIRHRAKLERFRRKYLLPHRHDDQRCPRCRAFLKSLKQGQRTTYYCPVCQH